MAAPINLHIAERKKINPLYMSNSIHTLSLNDYTWLSEINTCSLCIVELGLLLEINAFAPVSSAWPSGRSARLSRMKLGFDSQSHHHVFVFLFFFRIKTHLN